MKESNNNKNKNYKFYFIHWFSIEIYFNSYTKKQQKGDYSKKKRHLLHRILVITVRDALASCMGNFDFPP
jgi:hypothetical protein